ncbi:hypothetical protein [Acinetobacter populi]|uniref:Uncharacterized protein n=1 Tax=Acinetobacter populi TaxID=1582270 RepID=A0A1Z9Z1G7_9GAMM|nr:hypothetical protein [Acinetobacter populi]OUY08286.1 hypothetical protein CAP51_01300 [Acinetobacter populi]
MNVDPTGAIPIPVITGAIGGVMGGAASIGSQLAINGTQNFNWKNVGIAASVGAVAGAVSPWTASTAIGAVVTGSIASATQYGVTQLANNKALTVNGYIASAVLGGLGGGIAGAIPKSRFIPLDSRSPFISSKEAIRVNNLAEIRAVSSKNSLFSNFGGAMVSADIGGLGTRIADDSINKMNTQLGQNELNYNQYNSFQIGNPKTDPTFWTGNYPGLHLEISKQAGTW